jgi:hypothetical protein
MASGLAFAGSLGLYLVTMAPDLPPGHDSAELVTAAKVLGIAHPPGYPVYVLSGYLLLSVLPGDPAWIMNLFSAGSGALAVGLLALAISRLTGSNLSGLLAAGLFACARTPWRMAVGAEVFSLHLALVAALLAVTAFWREATESGRRTWLTVGCLVLGLGLAHHQTIVLVVPGVLGYLWLARDGRRLGWSLSCLAALALGLAPYAWIPWRAAQDPPLNWGNPDSPERFFWVLTRQGYGGIKLSQASGTRPAVVYHLEAWARSLFTYQYPFFGTVVGILGGALGFLRRKPEVLLFGMLWLLAGPVWAVVGAQPRGEGFLDMMERFYASSDLGFAGLIGLGLAWAGKSRRPWVGRLAVGACSLGLVAGFALNFPACSERGQHHVPDSLQAMLAGLPPGALVVTGNDLTSGIFLYATLVQGQPLDHLPAGLSASDWFLETLPPDRAQALRQGGLPGLLVQARSRGVPVYLDFLPTGVDGFFVPEGLLYRYLAPGEPIPSRESASRRSLAILEEVARQGDYSLTPQRPFWTRHLVRTWAWAYQTAGEGLAQADPAQAARALQTARRMLGESGPEED